MNRLEIFGSVETPKRHFLARDRVFWRIDRQNRPSRFCWARWQETNKIKNKKTNRNLICWPFVGGAPLIGWWWVLAYEELPRTLWIVLSLVLIGQGVSDLQGVNFGLLPLTDRPVLTTLLALPCSKWSRVGAVALYTVLWTVVVKYRKWRFSAPHRTKTP